MNIYCINNNCSTPQEILGCFETFMDDYKLNRIRKYRNCKDYENALFADILVRFAIFENAKIKYIRKPLLLTDYGKPYLPAEINMQFNISHSGNWVVCAIDDKAIGIDIELMQEADILGIAKDFFSLEEYDLLLNADNDIRKELFYGIWTLKESYIKALGKGLSIKLNSFSIIKANGTIDYNTQMQHEQCYFKQYNIDASYKLSVCSFNNDFPADVTYLDIDELYRFTLL